jgi:hypothetical protein
MKHLGYVLPLAAVLIGTALFAQEAPAAADAAGPKPARELFTTGAGVTDPGVLVLNAGAHTAHFRDGAQAQTFPAQLDLGICPWFDLRASWDGPTTLKDPQGASQSGGGDPWFGGQFQGLRQDQAGLDLGLAYWHKLPRASVAKGIGTGKADDTLLLTATRTDRSWEFDLNAGANWLGQQDADGRARQGVASLAVTRAFGAGWNVSLDNVALAAAGACPRTVTSILAVSRDLTPGLTLDLGAEAGLTRSAERLALDAGVVWRVGRLWGKAQ